MWRQKSFRKCSKLEDRKFAVYQEMRDWVERVIEEEKFTSQDIKETAEMFEEDLKELAEEKLKEVVK